jgi:hypothetical protein
MDGKKGKLHNGTTENCSTGVGGGYVGSHVVNARISFLARDDCGDSSTFPFLRAKGRSVVED